MGGAPESRPSVGVSAAVRGTPVTEAVRTRAIARLTYLWRWEAANVVLVPLIAAANLLAFGSSIGPATVVGAVLCSAWLSAGALYWKIKLDQVSTGTADAPLPRRRLFSTIRRIGPVVLGAASLGWIIPWAMGSTSRGDLIAGIVLWVSAVLEHINYFHRQLMHDTASDLRRLRATRRLRRSLLADDLARH